MGTEEIDLMTIKEANEWASGFLKRQIDASNISYKLREGKRKSDIGYKAKEILSVSL